VHGKTRRDREAAGGVGSSLLCSRSCLEFSPRTLGTGGAMGRAVPSLRASGAAARRWEKILVSSLLSDSWPKLPEVLSFPRRPGLNPKAELMMPQAEKFCWRPRRRTLVGWVQGLLCTAPPG